MVWLGIALMARPRPLLLEQNVKQALQIADRAYVMRAGTMILEDTAEPMRLRPDYWDLF